MVKGLSLIVCCLLLAGCATTQKSANPDMRGMQSRIDFLEDEMKAKDQEIGSIQNELRQVKQEYMRKYETSEDSVKRISNQSDVASKASAGEPEEIIRISGVTADKVQLALKRAGFYQGALDGKIGAKTKEAIKAFQKENGLTADGIVGRSTWAKLSGNL